MKKAYCKPATLVVKIQAVSMMATSGSYVRENYDCGGTSTWTEDEDEEPA